MKKFLLPFLLFGCLNGYSQVKVGNSPNTINSNSVLEIEASNKGVLLPRVALVNTSNAAPLSAHVNGMVVYNTATAGNVTPGFYYNNGSSWVKAGDMSSILFQEDGNASVSVGNGGLVNFVSGSNMNITRSGNNFTFNATPQNLTFSGSTLSISGGNSVNIPTGSNQSLSLANDALAISGGNSVSLAPYKNQISLNTSNNTLAVTNGGSVNLGTYRQTLSLSGTTLSISNGNSINIPTGSNQTISLNTSNNTLAITNGGSVNLGTYRQSLAISGNTLSISNGNSITLPAATNQTLSISGNTLSISNGNSVTLPGSSGSFWSTSGNSAGASDFIGTTNPASLFIRTNNIERIRINSSGTFRFGNLQSPSQRMMFVHGAYIDIENVNGSQTRSIWAANNSLKLSFNKFTGNHQGQEAEVVIFERSVHFNYNVGIKLPVGNTSERSGPVGMVRYNSQTQKFEGQCGSCPGNVNGWVNFH